MDFEKVKGVVDKFGEAVNEFFKDNQMSELKDFKDLQDKENIGEDYRHDQWYFENASNFKTKYFSLKAYISKNSIDSYDRVSSRKLENLVAYIDDQIKMLDNVISMAKQRIKFYESVIYLVSNFNYGNY
jgi:hypothetical protein